MSSRLVTPEDFGSEAPPDRIVGIETEYDIRRPDGSFDTEWTTSFFRAGSLGRAGLAGDVANHSAWLSNGAYIYPDVGHLEYCTPEALGPAEGVAAAHAGNLVLARLVQASGENYKIFRRSATVNAETGAIVTKGYHVNLGMPDTLCDPSTVMPLETHLATQVYAWGGLVTRQGYCISPKAFDIGDHITTINLANRTGRGSKPFGIIRPSGNDADTNDPQYGHGRLEDRTKTPSSQWSDFMGAVTTSLLMRVIENPALLPERKKLQALQLRNSITAFRRVAFDKEMTELYRLDDGREMSAVDIQEELAILGNTAADKLELPADEVYGAIQWTNIVDDLRRVQRGEADFGLVANRIGWAGKYAYLSRKLGHAAIETGSMDALRYCLSWDMVVPRGAGQVFDQKCGITIIPDEVTDRLATEAPAGTRAAVRAEYIKDGGTKHSELGHIRWPFVVLLQGGEQRRVALHPYETHRPKLGGRHGRKW